MIRAIVLSMVLVGAAHADEPHRLLFRGGRVFDGTRAFEADVLVENGLIREVGPKLKARSAQIIEAKGKTLLPGLIDAHTHAYEDKALIQAAVFGVTTECDLFGPIEKMRAVREKERRGEATGAADLRGAGHLATVPKGHGTEYGVPVPTLTRPEEAQAWVDARVAEGSDFIKIVYDDGAWFDGNGIPTLDLPTVAALIKAAHARGRLTLIHVGSMTGARAVIDLGADALAHIPFDRAPDPDFGKFVAAHHAFAIPTLAVKVKACEGGDIGELPHDPLIAPLLDEQDLKKLSRSWPKKLPAKNCEYAAQAVRQLKAAGVPILTGTDALNAGVVHGASMHVELSLLCAAGLTPVEALAAATSVPAARFGLTDRGRIAPGLRADLLLVDGDPTQDIHRTRAIAGVWKRGVPIDREAYRKSLQKMSAPNDR